MSCNLYSSVSLRSFKSAINEVFLFIYEKSFFAHYCSINAISFREMTSMEDDVYSFGLIILETLTGPAQAARGEAFLLNEMVRSSIEIRSLAL